MRIVSVVGTRPNFVKMAPVIAAINRRLPEAQHVLVHTGQHYDRSMSDIFFNELGIGEPDVMLGVGSGSHAVQTARVMERVEPVLAEVQPELVIVPGDVNSTMAAAVVASKLGVPIAHVESGLRSFDRTMPEEINRLITDALSELLFIHSQEGTDNLLREGVDAAKMHLVGNTMIDSLVAVEERFRSLHASETHGLSRGNYVLVTLHRPALVDGPLLGEAIDQLNELSRHVPVLFPIHPRTRSHLGSAALAPHLHVIDPIGYLEFLSLEADAAAVLTDSGGVQEETTYLGVPCFTLRDNTERPVTIRCGTNTLVGLDPGGIAEILPALEQRSGCSEQPVPPLWDGKAAERIADVVSAYVCAPERSDPPPGGATSFGEPSLPVRNERNRI